VQPDVTNGQEVVCLVPPHAADQQPPLRMAAALATRAGLGLVLAAVRPVVATAEEPMVDVLVPGVAGAPQVTATADLPQVDLEALAAAAEVRPHRLEHHDGTVEDVMDELAAAARTAVLVTDDAGGGPLTTKLRGNDARDALRDLRVPTVLVPRGCRVPEPDDALTVVCVVAERATPRAYVTRTAALAAAWRGSVVEVAVDATQPQGERLVRVVEASAPALVAVRPPEHGKLGSSILGSLTHDVLRNARHPVLVVPDAPA
jgi:hypothetical protein